MRWFDSFLLVPSFGCNHNREKVITNKIDLRDFENKNETERRSHWYLLDLLMFPGHRNIPHVELEIESLKIDADKNFSNPLEYDIFKKMINAEIFFPPSPKKQQKERN
jgi:hypothetical protein